MYFQKGILKMEIVRSGYRITLDESTGKWTGLFDPYRPEDNWLKENDATGFCTPFIHGTQFGEDFLVCPLVMSKDGIHGATQSGATNLKIVAEEKIIRGYFNTPVDNGPRIGLQMNLNLLDLPYKGSWKQQCMPKIIYVDEEYQYAYLVFGTADHRYLILTVSLPLAAWRIHYSYEGHRMTGFQLLTQADDVRTDGRKCLPAVGKLDFQIQFSDSISECMAKVSTVLKKPIAVPRISGGPMGARIPFDVLGDCWQMYVLDPDVVESKLEGNSLCLEKRGIYQIITISRDGNKHISRVLCHESWEEQFDRVNHFYRNHLQHECGAFYRAISTDTLLPDKDVVGGSSMGDPNCHYSCRTGEFGGFAAWAMLKNELVFGNKPDLHESAERYMLNWALNRGHEDTPYLGTLYKKPNQYLGREYGPYHIYEEYNYFQHEIFLLEEMADYYKLTYDKGIMEDAIALTEHIVAEHMREDGAVINQNFPNEAGVDYSTVHIPVCGFLRWAEILEHDNPEKAKRMRDIAERIADHVCRRALDFPTEGEPCTEDGSMGCAVATLVYAYTQVAPKPEYLAVAKEILDAHDVLEMDGTDCRMKSSTIRFWETQYETRDWGASINAGHAWTIWTAEAKAALALIEKDYQLLQEAYEGFISNICKVSDDGGMYSCYTPDMIPGTPHAYYLDCMTDQELEHNDLRPTTTHLGMTYPSGAFATSGNYYLIKAAEFWTRISGLNLDNKTAVNGTFDGDTFQSTADHFDCLLLSGKQENAVRIWTGDQKTIKILVSDGSLQIEGVQIIAQEDNCWEVICENEYFVVKTCN